MMGMEFKQQRESKEFWKEMEFEKEGWELYKRKCNFLILLYYNLTSSVRSRRDSYNNILSRQLWTDMISMHVAYHVGPKLTWLVLTLPLWS